MSSYFLDTSALAKRYVVETGTVWMRNLTRRSTGNVIIVAEIIRTEMFSLLTRRRRDSSLAAAIVAQLQTAFLAHLKFDYLIVHVDTNLLNASSVLVDKHPLRTLDAVQLACAVEASKLLGEAITFITGDRNLLAAALAEGFATDNPYLHP